MSQLREAVAALKAILSPDTRYILLLVKRGVAGENEVKFDTEFVTNMQEDGALSIMKSIAKNEEDSRETEFPDPVVAKIDGGKLYSHDG